MELVRLAIGLYGMLLATAALAQQGGPAGGPPRGQLPPLPPMQIPPNVQVTRDIEYVKGGGASRSLDLYLPRNASERGPLPLVVWIHGGAWLAGDKGHNPAIQLMQAGFATASINYRLSREARFPAQIEDCKAAIRFLRANAKQYNIDPDRIGVWGASAGGHLAAMLGVTGSVREFETGDYLDVSSRVQAAADWFGPTDLPAMDGPDDPAEKKLPEPKQVHNGPTSPEAQLIGGPIEQNLDKARAASPITYVSADTPPFLILHGDSDPLIRLSQSRSLYEALRKANVDARLYILTDSGHGTGLFTRPESTAMVRQFFITTLQRERQ